MNIEDVFGDLSSLETERLLLRKLTLDDALEVFAYASDPEVARFTTWEAHKTIDDSVGFLGRVIDLYNSRQVANWGVVHKETQRVIGTCGFVYWLPQHARAEIAYALAREYWRQGYMTEAVSEVVAFGFHVMQLNRIEARCEIENIGSARVMEKAGMTFEGVLRGHMYAKGAFSDLKIYSILRAEWLRESVSHLAFVRAEEADAEGIQQVAAESWRATYRDIYTPEFIADFLRRNYSVEGLIRSVQQPDAVVFVAKAGDRVVGFCHFGMARRGPMLFRMYVLPAHWRQGIGTRFVDLMDADWRSRDVSLYHCYVHSRNEIGKAFYLKHGFAHDPARDEGDEWCMVKTIA